MDIIPAEEKDLRVTMTRLQAVFQNIQYARASAALRSINDYFNNRRHVKCVAISDILNYHKS